ncbi:MAG: hypothetical protein VB144_10450 [Clostridia bacterium]|nr:hypothetical protein [Clostridia bacterium]
MKHGGLRMVAIFVALLISFGSVTVIAAPVTVVEGSPVVFSGLSIIHDDDRLSLKVNWVGLASDLEWNGATFRLGGAVNPGVAGSSLGTTAYTFGLGADVAKMFSLVAAVEASGMLYVQDNGDGARLAGVGRATGSTARIGLTTDFGMAPEGFDAMPARLIGQERWPDRPGVDLAGRGWANLTAALQTSRTRADSVRIGYTKELGAENWRADVGYGGKYSPEGLGVAVKLYSGVAFGAPAVTLISELALRADVTDRAGAEVAVIAQSGGASQHVWLSGSGWLSLGDRADVKLTVSAPVVGGSDYDGPALFRPINSAAMSFGFEFSQGLISSVNGRYDFQTKTVGLELASRF